MCACTFAALSCGGKGGVPPSAVIEEPSISCPADLEVLEHNGQPPAVAFDIPAGSKGSPPLAVVCSPGSGTPFGSGTTTVGCEVTDSRAHKASCSFAVVVKPVPRLLKTTFVAFGDSLTEGKHHLSRPTILKVPTDSSINPPIYNEGGSYPELLNSKLAARYEDQTITMIAFGRGLEKAGEGKLRLRDYWHAVNADAVLLLEGVNDLTDRTTGTPEGMNDAINSVIDALRFDIGVAKQHGAAVFLGTLIPITSPQPQNVIAAVPVLNSRIKALAIEQNVALVDLNAAVPAASIGSDGIHPASGSDAYARMADEWMKAIVQKFEAPPQTNTLGR